MNARNEEIPTTKLVAPVGSQKNSKVTILDLEKLVAAEAGPKEICTAMVAYSGKPLNELANQDTVRKAYMGATEEHQKATKDLFLAAKRAATEKHPGNKARINAVAVAHNQGLVGFFIEMRDKKSFAKQMKSFRDDGTLASISDITTRLEEEGCIDVDRSGEGGRSH